MVLEDKHFDEYGIATLTSIFINANRDPKKSQPAKPQDFFYFENRSDDVIISISGADCFFELLRENLLPGWCVSVLDIEKLNKAKKGMSVSRPRAAIGKGLIIFNPKVIDTKLKGNLAVVFENFGLIEVGDIDSKGEGETLCVDVPFQDADSYWITDAEFEIVG